MRYDFSIDHVERRFLYTADALSQAPIDQEWRTPVWSRVLCECSHGLASCIWAQTWRYSYWAKEGRHSQSSNAVHAAWVARWQEEAIRPNSQVLGRKRKPLGIWWPSVEGATTCNTTMPEERHSPPPTRWPPRTDENRENAASSVWLNGISPYMERMVRKCEKYRKERTEPMRGTKFTDHSWSRVGADFFQHVGQVYLLVVDYYSCDVESQRCLNT